MTTPLEKLGQQLAGINSSGTFTTKRNASTKDLHLEVRGVGLLRFPVSAAEAKKLCQLARPPR